MSETEVIAALPTDADADSALLRNYLIKRTIYPLDDSEDPEAFEALDADTGAIPRGIAWGGIVFWLDSDDTTTAHDGVTTLVTSDGYRYKYDGLDYLVRSVLDNDLTAPPGSESYGDAYIVAAGATGDWAGQSEKIAMFTSRGWKFILPKIGHMIYVEDEDTYYHYDVAGDWIAGFGNTTLSSNVILPANVVGGRVSWTVENQTTNTPPGAPATGVQYIIGSSPTGVWAGNASKLTVYNGLSWTIVTPVEGYLAWDKALDKLYYYSGAAWTPFSSGLTFLSTQLLSGAVATIDFTSFDSNFDDFVFELTAVRPATDGSNLLLRVGTGAGPSWQATGYSYLSVNWGAGTTPTEDGEGAVSAGTSISLTSGPGAGGGIDSASAQGLTGRIRFNSPSNAAIRTLFKSDIGFQEEATAAVYSFSSGVRTTTEAITGVRFLMSAGNIAAGRFTLYGISKTG